DPMIRNAIGGVNVFGGGLALYDASGQLLGGLGVSGDTSCTDHIVAWKTRFSLNLDNVPGGVSATGDDNLIIATAVTPNTFQHPNCGNQGEVEIIADLPTNFPIGGDD
ncbi:MAG: heme-binding protein, partial [Geminicoccaceae bacterium]